MKTLASIVCDFSNCEKSITRPRYTDIAGTATYLGAHGWGMVLVPSHRMLCPLHKPTTARRAAA